MTASATTDYDVFISYRRAQGAEVARLIQFGLMSHGLKVFLDVDNLESGRFDERLLDTIGATPGFIVILASDTLARCRDPEDWVRKEIIHAIQTQRRIVPIISEGFDFAGEGLPEELAALRRHNGLKYNHEYFEPMIVKLLDFLGRRSERGGAPSPAVNRRTRSPEFLFLDFDGVLRSLSGEPYVFDPECLRHFEELMRRHPSTKIVISSRWRLGMTRREMSRQFSADIRARIVGVTPHSLEDDGASREKEILSYLANIGQPDATWVAIDDNPKRFRRGCRNLLLTDPQLGLDAAAVKSFDSLLPPNAG